MPIRNLFRLALSSPFLSDIAKSVLSPWVTVFMVHRVVAAGEGISGVTPDHLRNCLRYLRDNNYQFISIDDAINQTLAGSLPRKKWVCFTIDDGFLDQVTTAAEIFAEFDCPATCFLVSGLVDGQIWPWDYQLKYIAAQARPQVIRVDIEGQTHELTMSGPESRHMLLKFVRSTAPDRAYELTAAIARAADVEMPALPPQQMLPATWDSVRVAEKTGMRFGAHSVHHFILSRLSDSQLLTEITRSVLRVQQECRNPSAVFCYPSGKADEFDTRGINIVKDLGLHGAVSAEPGYLEPRKIQEHADYRFTIPRMPLPTSLDDFVFYVSWAQYVRERATPSKLASLYRR